MSYCYIEIPVSKKDIKIIKEEFQNYIDQCVTVTINMNFENETGTSKKLVGTLGRLFVQFLAAIESGNFEKTH